MTSQRKTGFAITCACGLAIASVPAIGQLPVEQRPIRMGTRGSIIAVHPGPQAPGNIAASGLPAPFPEPRLAGYSPLVALSATDERSDDEIDYEHDLQTLYTCDPMPDPPPDVCASLNAPAHTNYVVGIVDTGAVVDLLAGIAPFILGVDGPHLTNHTIPIGGVGGTVDAFVSQPIGYYAAGLQAIDEFGSLDPAGLIGHSNVSIVVAPPIVCDTGESVTGVIGTPFLAFYNTIISVDTPRRVVIDELLYKSPDLVIQDQAFPLPAYDHSVAVEPGGISPVSTASYFPDLEDLDDLETPGLPTQLSLTPASFPTGALFFVNLRLREGPAGDNNPVQTFRFMFDTGAQSSIISPAVAAELNLPVTPDFTVDVCGVGGSVSGVPAYYVDYARINALGGALEFSDAPFVVLDLPSPEGGALDGVLGMNFFWNRNLAFEPTLSASSFFHLSAPIPVAPLDFDVDQRVDGDDLWILTQCLTGPAAAASPECTHLDVTADGRVDARDAAWLQTCFSGTEQPTNVNCGP